MIPLVDLSIQQEEIESEVRAGWDRVLRHSGYVLGPEVKAFEDAFASFTGVAHCVGVANGTDALELALRAIDVGPGAEVILPANSFVATAFAVERAGAKPVLVDIDPFTYLISPSDVKLRLGASTRAVMPVHLYGQLAPLEELGAITGPRDVAIVEDAAQAQGARRHNRHAGYTSVAAGVSFYPGKNLGAYGDAGAVLTMSESVGERVRKLRNYGGEEKYEHVELGFNSRLDSLQAVVLSAKLARLDRWNQARQRAAALYDELLADMPNVVLPVTLAGNEHVWHLYVVRVPRRDQVLERMRADGVGVGIHYPTPIHLCPAFAHLGHGPGEFPIAEEASRTILSLPLYPGITEAQQRAVAGALQRALDE